MHINKLHFYRSSAKSLREFFSAILNNKLHELSRIVEAAQRNIERFQQIVRISSSNLTKTWMELDAKINTGIDQALESAPALSELPREYTGFKSVVAKRGEVLAELQRSAKYHAGSIGASHRAAVTAALQSHSYEIQRYISGTDLEALSAQDIAVLHGPTIPTPALSEFYTATSVHNRVYELRESEAEALRDVAGLVRRSLSGLQEQAARCTAIATSSQAVAAGADSLASDLNQFFQTVELYRSGVFSHTTKESIATLGIGAKLDELEAEFTDDDREQFTALAINSLYPGASEAINIASSKMFDVARSASEALEDARQIRIDKPEENRDQLQVTFESETHKLQQDIAAASQADVNRFCGNVGVTLGALIVAAKLQCDSDLTLLHRARVKRYSLAFAITGIIFACGSMAFHYWGKAAPSSLGETALVNLGCGLLVEALVLLVIKMRENVPQMLAQTRQQIKSNLEEKVKHALEAELKNFALNSLSEAELVGRMTRMYQFGVDLPSTDWRTRAAGLIDHLRQSIRKYSTVLEVYAAALNQLRQDTTRYFTDNEKNLEILNDVADRIRSKAIAPSFELLENTRATLSTIKAQVESIEFDS